jgi:NADPH-dependent curcumin reductase CurA
MLSSDQQEAQAEQLVRTEIITVYQALVGDGKGSIRRRNKVIFARQLRRLETAKLHATHCLSGLSLLGFLGYMGFSGIGRFQRNTLKVRAKIGAATQRAAWIAKMHEVLLESGFQEHCLS